MDPRDQPRMLSDGAGCTVCDAVVPVDRIRLLARRDDLAFIQLDCAACASITLGFVFADALPPESVRFADPTPIDGDDVLDMHQLLDGWRGDLRGLLERRTARLAGDRATERSRSGRVPEGKGVAR